METNETPLDPPLLTEEEIAHDLIQVLSVNYSISSDHLIAAMWNRASVNGQVMKTVKMVYTKIFSCC